MKDCSAALTGSEPMQLRLTHIIITVIRTIMTTYMDTESITMSKKKFYALMQMNGGTFPTGGFSQSWGLETYVAEGKVYDSDTFEKFLDVYLDSCIGRCEGPVLIRAY